MVEEIALRELERLKEELRALLPQLSKWRVEELRMRITQYHETKWAWRDLNSRHPAFFLIKPLSKKFKL